MILRPWIEAYLCSPVYRECAAVLQRDGWKFEYGDAKHACGLTLSVGNTWLGLQPDPVVAGAGLGYFDKWMLRHWVHLARARGLRHDVIKWEVEEQA